MQKENMELLFSYGTLQLAGVQMETFGRRIRGEADILPGYALGEITITDPAVIQSSGTNIHPILKFTGDPEDEIPGTALEVTPNELNNADKYEVDDYQRVAAKLKSGRTAWIYVAAKQVP